MTDTSGFWRAFAASSALAKSGDKDALVRTLSDAVRALRGMAQNDRDEKRAIIERMATLYEIELPEGLDSDLASNQRSGVSLVTCCRNRNENLLRALPSWLACPEVSEIIIVDWTSGDLVSPAIADAGITDPRIVVVRVEDEPRWILSHAFNIGFQYATYDRILKADADIVLDKDFFRLNPLRPGQFIAGNWRRAKEGQSFVNGFFYVWHEPLMEIGGFNEYITTYGWDDDELYGRLLEHGLSRRDVICETILHLPHDDAARTEKAPPPADAPAAETLPADTAFLIRRNRQLTNLMPAWNGTRPPVEYDVLSDVAHEPVLRRRAGSGETPPATIEAEAFAGGARELLAWRLGDFVYSVPHANIYALLKTVPWAEIDITDVVTAAAVDPDEFSRDGKWIFVDARWIGQDDANQAWSSLKDGVTRLGLTAIWQGLKPYGFVGHIITHDGAVTIGEPITLNQLQKGKPVKARAYTICARELGPDGAPAVPGEAKPATPAVQTNRRAKVFADGQHGLGNRLRAIASAAAIAEKTDRELVVVWEPDHHCDCRLSDLFDYDGAVEEQSFVTQAQSRGADVFNYMEIEPGAQKDQEVVLDPARDVYLRSAYVLNHPASDWTSENHFLQSLRPSEDVLGYTDTVRWPNDLSVHVRMAGGKEFEHLPWESIDNWTQEGHDQVAYWRERSHYSNFLKRVDQLIEEGEVSRLFVAADLPQTYDVFEQRYGDKLACLRREVNDRSAEQLKYALADAMLLARSPRMLGSNWSSFSELAMRLAVTPMKVEMSGTDF